MNFEPICKEHQLLYGQADSAAAVITGWTIKEKVRAALTAGAGRSCAMGQLYSPAQGIDFLVRNLLANPQVRALARHGVDLSGAGRALDDFFAHGVRPGTTPQGRPVWEIVSDVPAFIGQDIPEAALTDLRRGVRSTVTTSIADLDAWLVVHGAPGAPWAPARQVYLPPTLDRQFWPAEATGYVVRGATVAETWVRLLDVIQRFGRVVSTHYDAETREVLDLVSVVEAEDPVNPALPAWLGVDAAQLESYRAQLLAGETIPGVKYNYGARMRTWFATDQIAGVIGKLVAEGIGARSAVVSLWDPRWDLDHSGSPCLNQLWFRLRDGRLYLTAVIRSNDMFRAWPLNALGLRFVQEAVRQQVETATGPLGLGSLTIHSESAHYYADADAEVQAVVAAHPPRIERFDPRGNYLVDVRDGAIVVEHLSPDGEALRTARFTTARAATLAIARWVADSEHMGYLGRELQKAEIALRFPDRFTYVQDLDLQPDRAGAMAEPRADQSASPEPPGTGHD